MKKLTFKPGMDILAVKHLPEPETTASGIIVEAIRKEKYPARGEVVAVGPNPSLDMEVGDVVLYNMAVEEGVKCDGYIFDLVLSQNILGSFPKDK